ncbi:hypothetical protein BU198_25370 [Streptomyces sp. CBMA156]|nr:hypothetical protein [Streptomyces sp. CBMA156]
MNATRRDVNPYRDPDCSCGWSPVRGHLQCQNCSLNGPLPGSRADPDWQLNMCDPEKLRAAADRLTGRVPPITAGPRTVQDRRILAQAESLREEADRLANEASA